MLMHINEKQWYNDDKSAWLVTFEWVHITCSYLVGGWVGGTRQGLWC
jgi:hypothetical protein